MKTPLHLLRSIIIPAGTVFHKAAEKTQRAGEGHVEATVGLSKNTSGTITYFAGEPDSIERAELNDLFSEELTDEPHVLRTKCEKADRERDAHLLRTFIESDPIFLSLPDRQKELMRTRLLVMEAYLSILSAELDPVTGGHPVAEGIPRKHDALRQTGLEILLTTALLGVENSVADTRMTEASRHVVRARDLVASVVDGESAPPLREEDKLNAAEAVFGFAGWLTTRGVVLSTVDCAGFAEACAEFIRANNLGAVRETWPNNLVHPSGECSHGGNQPEMRVTRGEAIIKAKTFRQTLDPVLQAMKVHAKRLANSLANPELLSEDTPMDDPMEHILQHRLAIHDLESSMMRLGMTLKAIGTDNPYPNSKDPSNHVVDKTADGLKM